MKKNDSLFAAPPKVSVVVPVYNTADYLDECMESIVGQTLRDIEVICVDDGSTDASPEKLAAWAAKDPRIRILRQENRGGGAARNAGMDAAGGDYLFFCDSDDACEPAMLEEMVAAADATDSDVVVSPRALWDESLRTIVSTTRFSQRIVSATMPFPARALGAELFVFSGNTAWNKLFRRTFARTFGIRFQESRRSNDLSFVNCALALSDRISVCDKALYRYRSGRVGGAVHSAEENPLSLFEAFGHLRGELTSRRLFDDFATAFAKALFISSGYQMSRFRSGESVALSHARLREAMQGLRPLCDLSGEDVLDEFQKEAYRILLESEDPVAFLLASWRLTIARANTLALGADRFRSKWQEEARKRAEVIASFRANREKALDEFRANQLRWKSENQMLSEKLDGAERKIQSVKRKLSRAKKAARSQRRRFERSLSWRATAPLRFVSSVLSRLCGGQLK